MSKKSGCLLSEYNAEIRSTLQSVLNIALSDDKSWDQVTLPVANGGLDIQRATDIAIFAFLSPGCKANFYRSAHTKQLNGISSTNEPSFTVAVSEWQFRTYLTAATQKVWTC